MKTFIAFRLRKELDADLIDLNIDDRELPELCRTGLRLALGIRTKKMVQVVEQQIEIGAKHPAEQQRVIPVQSKPATFKGPLINNQAR